MISIWLNLFCCLHEIAQQKKHIFHKWHPFSFILLFVLYFWMSTKQITGHFQRTPICFSHFLKSKLTTWRTMRFGTSKSMSCVVTVTAIIIIYQSHYEIDNSRERASFCDIEMYVCLLISFLLWEQRVSVAMIGGIGNSIWLSFLEIWSKNHK